jgi:hypothetical protein
VVDCCDFVDVRLSDQIIWCGLRKYGQGSQTCVWLNHVWGREPAAVWLVLWQPSCMGGFQWAEVHSAGVLPIETKCRSSLGRALPAPSGPRPRTGSSSWNETQSNPLRVEKKEILLRLGTAAAVEFPQNQLPRLVLKDCHLAGCEQSVSAFPFCQLFPRPNQAAAHPGGV